jgi:transposase
MWHRVELVCTDVSEEVIASIFMVEKFLLADFSNLKMEVIRSSETSVHTRSTRSQIPEDGILHMKRVVCDVRYVRNWIRINMHSYLFNVWIRILQRSDVSHSKDCNYCWQQEVPPVSLQQSVIFYNIHWTDSGDGQTHAQLIKHFHNILINEMFFRWTELFRNKFLFRDHDGAILRHWQGDSRTDDDRKENCVASKWDEWHGIWELRVNPEWRQRGFRRLTLAR